jgi:hypothetical protein
MVLLLRKLALKKSRGMHERHAREKKALIGHQGMLCITLHGVNAHMGGTTV